MKRCIFVGILLLTLASLAFAAQVDIQKHRSCNYCGMDRGTFAQSRMLVEYDDGSSAGVCSLRCAAVELVNNLDKTPARIGVGDYAGKQLIDAEKAVWVIGGSKPGVMTAKAKWAFATKEGAEAFIKENGGTLATFETAVQAAYDDIYQDTKTIRERRKMKRMKH